MSATPAPAAAPRVRAAIYCRLSRKGGRSVQRQKQDGKALAAERGWDVPGEDAIYEETASASRFAKQARKRWGELKAAIERREYDAVILWMEDRSNRDVVEAGEFWRLCQEVGLRHIVLPSYEYDLSDPEDEARFYGEVLAAQREVAKTSKRVKRARLAEAEAGEPHPGGKRGFGDPGGRRVRDPEKLSEEYDDDPFKWLRDGRGHWKRVGIVPDEQVARERELIREAAERIERDDSLRGIVTDWNERGVRGAAGEHWETRSLRRTLLSPRLAGWRDHLGAIVTKEGDGLDDDGKPIREPVPLAAGLNEEGEPIPQAPILEPELWQVVYEKLTDPARRDRAGDPLAVARGGVARHLLTGFAYCGVCGARCVVNRVRGVRFYACPSRSGGGKRCTARHADWLDGLITGALFKAVESDEWDRRAAEADRPPGDPTAELWERLSRDQARLDRLDDDQLLAELDNDKRRAASVARVRRETEERMERTHAMIRRRTSAGVVARVPKNLRQAWPEFSLDRQREILRSVLTKVEILPLAGPNQVFDVSRIVPTWKHPAAS